VTGCVTLGAVLGTIGSMNASSALSSAVAAPMRTVPASLRTTAAGIIELFTALTHQLSGSTDGQQVRVPRTDLPGFVARGRYLVVRPLNRDDSALLRQFLSVGLSEQSRQLRFLSAGFRVTPTVVEYLAARDGRDRVALAAFVCDHDGELVEIAGLVEYALAPSMPDAAMPEVALAVADYWQGAGVGSRLLTMLAVLSVAGGYDRWSATVAVDNAASFAALSHVGEVSVLSDSAGVADIVVQLSTPT